MARTYLEAFACVRPIERCKVYSPSKTNRERFAREMAEQLGIEVIAVDTPREAVAGVDILSSCTNGMRAVYESAWIEPGMHVTNVQDNELPDDAAERFDVIIRQGENGLPLAPSDRIRAGVGQSPTAFVGGTVEEMQRLPAPRETAGRSGSATRFRSAPEFAALANGTCAGRTSREQVTFYRNAGNQGLQFSSVGGWVYSLARERGIGHEIPTSWFLQNIRD
jgi:alanine dehydrogenase